MALHQPVSWRKGCTGQGLPVMIAKNKVILGVRCPPHSIGHGST
jgi:hypothetical protein